MFKRLFCIHLYYVFILALLCGCPDQKDKPSALDVTKEKAREHYLKGRRLFLTNNPSNYPLAVSEFTRALEFWPDYPEANAAIAETYSMSKGFNMTDDQFAMAFTYAQRSIRLNPQLSMGYRAMSDLLRHKHNNEQAMLQIQRAIQLDPNSAENYYVRGSILLASDPNTAREDFQRALSIDQHLARAYFNIAVAYQQLDDLETAIKYIKIYQEMVPQDLGGYCSLGVIYRQAGKIPLAIEQLEQVLAKDQKTDMQLMEMQSQWVYTAYLVLGQIYSRDMGKHKQALPLLEKAHRIYPNTMEALRELIYVHQQLGEEDKASEYKEKLKQSEQMLEQLSKESVLEKGIPKDYLEPEEKPENTTE